MAGWFETRARRLAYGVGSAFRVRDSSGSPAQERPCGRVPRGGCDEGADPAVPRPLAATIPTHIGAATADGPARAWACARGKGYAQRQSRRLHSILTYFGIRDVILHPFPEIEECKRQYEGTDAQ